MRIRTCLLTRAIFILLFSSLLAPAVSAGNILPAPRQVSKHVYAWIGPHGGPTAENRGFRMNLGFIVGEKSVLMLETGYSIAMAKEMVAHIKRITPLPIRYAVNLNSQPDRFLGNGVFRKLGAEIITTPEEAKRMADLGGIFTGIVERILSLKPDSFLPPEAPTKLIISSHVIDLGGVTARLEPMGPTHTPNAIAVVIEKDKVVYAGDNLYSGRLLAVIDGGSVKNWLEVFGKFRAYSGYTFVPGHGEPAPLKDFEFSTFQYLTLLHTYMTSAVEDDVSLQKAVETIDQSAFKVLENFDLLAGRNANFAYLEAEAASFD